MRRGSRPRAGDGASTDAIVEKIVTVPMAVRQDVDQSAAVLTAEHVEKIVQQRVDPSVVVPTAEYVEKIADVEGQTEELVEVVHMPQGGQ